MSFDFSDLADHAPAAAEVAATYPPPTRLEPHHETFTLASENLISLWREAARSDLATILLPTAIRTLGVIMRDEMAPASARVAAAKTVLGAALPEQSANAAKKALHEMSAAEIESALYALRDEINDRSMSKGNELACF